MNRKKNLEFDNLVNFLINYLDHNPEDGLKLITQLCKKYPRHFLKGSDLYKKVLLNSTVTNNLKSRSAQLVDNIEKTNALIVELRKRNH